MTEEKKDEITEAVEGIRDGVGEIRTEIETLTGRMEAAESEIRKAPSVPGLEDYTDKWSWGDYVRLIKGFPCKEGFTRSVVEEVRANVGATSSNAPVPTEVANTIIEPLKAQSSMAQAGATFMEGLSGTVNLPVGAVAELQARTDDSATPAVSDQTANWTFTNKSLTANYSGELVIVSRDLLAQDVPSVDAFIQNEMVKAARRKIDNIGIAEITGNITGATGGADFSRALLETGMGTLMAANADISDLTLMGHPGNLTNLMSDTASAGRPWLPFASLSSLSEATGIRVISSTGFNADGSTDGEAVLADFSDLVIGLFGSGVEVSSSEDYKFGDNAVTFRVVLSADAAVLRSGSFVYWDDLT